MICRKELYMFVLQVQHITYFLFMRVHEGFYLKVFVLVCIEKRWTVAYQIFIEGPWSLFWSNIWPQLHIKEQIKHLVPNPVKPPNIWPHPTSGYKCNYVRQSFCSARQCMSSTDYYWQPACKPTHEIWQQHGRLENVLVLRFSCVFTMLPKSILFG